MFEHVKRYFGCSKCGGGGEGKGRKLFAGLKYTPLDEKGINKVRNKSMETTTNLDLNAHLNNCLKSTF